VVAAKRGRLGEAADWIQRAVRADGRVAHYRRNLAEVLRRLGRLDEALAEAEGAVALSPADAEARYNLGLIHYDRLDPQAAIAALSGALALNPGHAGAHFELAECLLLQGDYERGWEEYEWRFRLPGARKPRPPGFKPEWDGGPLGAPLLVMADQGFGDVIQFMRFLPLAKARCTGLHLIGGRQVQPILAQAGAGVVTDQWSEVEPFAAHAVLSSLPRLLGTRAETIPALVPYLMADPAKAAAWKARLDASAPPGLKRIGLVWSGRVGFGGDVGRALPFEALKPLTELKGVALVSLQMGEARVELDGYAGRAPLVDLGGEIGDFADTMAILHGLDRLVSVDTSVAHLAGAMGRPVSILLRYAPDWRWGLGRSDSAWYPTAELYRQAAPGRWDAPVAAVAARLGG
jgi:hypothetical protein